MPKLRELIEEFRLVVVGRGSLVDTAAPPLAYVLGYQTLGLWWGVAGAVLVALALGVVRLRRGQTLAYSLGGLGAFALSAASALWSGRAQDYFLPGLVQGAALALATVVSLVVRRPLVALASHAARHWPLEWYRHPLVSRAYTEVTWAWAAFFAARLALETYLYLSARDLTLFLALARILSGWPATVVLLAASYLYGSWRLKSLGGPSVDEFTAGTPPPWRGQQRGY